MKTVFTEVKTTMEVALTARDIISALGLPDDAKVFFEVPTGGDYSGCTLDIDDDTPVRARWVKVEQ